MTTETEIIHLAARHGAVLSGRALATQIRHHIEARVAIGRRVVIDFDGIDAMSPSFADELFGKLARATVTGAVRFEGLSDHLDTVRRLAERTRSGTSRGAG